MILYNISFFIIRQDFALSSKNWTRLCPPVRMQCDVFDEILSISKNGAMFLVKYTVCTRKFQIQDIGVILHRLAGFERTFYSDFTRDLITRGIFIPRRFRRMFMEYPDNAGAAFWLNSTYYATVKRILHRYIPRGSFLSRNEYLQ